MALRMGMAVSQSLVYCRNALWDFSSTLRSVVKVLLGKKSADERLAAFLLSLSRRLRKRGLCPTDFFLSMSRHEIGNYLGLAVETVSRLFTRFQDEKLLKVDRKHVKLKDLPALEAIVSGAPAAQCFRAGFGGSAGDAQVRPAAGAGPVAGE